MIKEVTHIWRILASSSISLLICSCSGSMDYVRFPSAAIDSPDNVRAIEYKPEGEGPFPAVVVMHHGGGLYVRPGTIHSNLRRWAQQLKNWGFVSLLVDTYGSRDYSHVNQVGSYRESADQISDAHGAHKYLSKLPFVDGDRIGILGFSRGGLTVINGMEEPGYFQNILFGRIPERELFQAGVAMYPVCRHHYQTTLLGPLLILIGELDPELWECERIANNTNPEGAKAEIVIYPGAKHAFDERNAYDWNAAKDSKDQVRKFFQHHLSKSE